jgi:hypothetical protein
MREPSILPERKYPPGTRQPPVARLWVALVVTAAFVVALGIVVLS